MSIVNRAQFSKTVTVSFPNVTETTFDVPRPETTPKEPAYAEGTDHVTKLPGTDEDYAGEVIVRLPSTLQLATVFLRSVEIRKLLPTAQKGIAGPGGALFPSGAAVDSEHVRHIMQETANKIDMATAPGTTLLGDADPTNVAAGGLTRSYPGITLRAGEYVRCALYNNSGGALTDQIISAYYTMGQHQTDVGRP
jgi:hypothetical protein